MRTSRILSINILRVLSHVSEGVREKILRAEVEIAIDGASITSDEFADALADLEERKLIANRRNLIGDVVWSITPAGNAALQGK